MKNKRSGKLHTIPAVGRRVLCLFLLLLLCLLCLFLTSCRGIELENKTEQVEEYTQAQAMILVANERNRYQNAYSGGIWELPVSEGGETFDSLLISNVREYLEQIKLLNMLAEERGVSVTSRERDLIRQMTDEYLAGLTKEDLAYIGCSRDDVQKMYTDCYMACRMAALLTENAAADISDSEVKVIHILQFGTADVKKAKAVLRKLKIDGEDFKAMAGRYSELAEIEIELAKGTSGGLLEKTAFSMEEGEVSNILCSGGMYYIIKVTDGYDREATQNRKQNLETAVKSLHFSEALEPYAAKHQIAFFASFWENIDLKAGEGSDAENFFDIFRTYADF